MAYTKPQQREKEESERLRGERDEIKFIDLGFEGGEVVGFGQKRRKQFLLGYFSPFRSTVDVGRKDFSPIVEGRISRNDSSPFYFSKDLQMASVKVFIVMMIVAMVALDVADAYFRLGREADARRATRTSVDKLDEIIIAKKVLRSIANCVMQVASDSLLL